jgi:hypothetical protein
MRKFATALICVLLTARLLADEATDRARATATRKQMQDLATGIEAYLSDYPTLPADFDAMARGLEGTYLREVPKVDAWGTSFRYEGKGKSYRIISAGSDKKFDPATWDTSLKTADTSADAVASNSGVMRVWVFDKDPTAAAVRAEAAGINEKINTLPEKERMPYFWRWSTAAHMDQIAVALEKYAKAHKTYPSATTIDELKTALYPDYIDEMRVNDFWGTPFRYAPRDGGSSYILVSAGSERTFRSESWPAAGVFDSDAEDAVIVKGKHVREWKLLK